MAWKCSKGVWLSWILVPPCPEGVCATTKELPEGKMTGAQFWLRAPGSLREKLRLVGGKVVFMRGDGLRGSEVKVGR